jgi:hypothetical protein
MPFLRWSSAASAVATRGDSDSITEGSASSPATLPGEPVEIRCRPSRIDVDLKI